jgi:hypothetical protein
MRAAVHQRLHDGLAGVEDRDVVACIQKALGHPPAHSPNADESNVFVGHG